MTVENTDDRKKNGDLAVSRTGLSGMGNPDDTWLAGLLARRLIFVMGKGGVGKTTISIALATVAERMNKKVLLAELGDTGSLGQLFLGQALTAAPRQLTKGIWGARVDSKAELEAYVRAHVASKFISGKIVRSRLFDYLFEAAPGLKEVMSLGRLWRWEKENSSPSGSRFDLIIVDAPATGHAMSLLRLPDILTNMIRVGPLANQIRSLQRLLKDHNKTSLVLVSLPEELPVNETMEFHSMAQKVLNMPVSATFINCVVPAVFSSSDLTQLKSVEQALRRQPAAPENVLIDSAKSLIRRQKSQFGHIRHICENATAHVLEMPYRFTNDLTLSEIRDLSFHIHPGCSKPSEDLS